MIKSKIFISLLLWLLPFGVFGEYSTIGGPYTQVLAKGTSVNLNTTDNQYLTPICQNFLITDVIVTNFSATIANAQFNLLIGAGGALNGDQVDLAAMDQDGYYRLSNLLCTTNGKPSTSTTNINFKIAEVEGSAATADVYIVGICL